MALQNSVSVSITGGTITGTTVDGRNVGTDGSKLDGIEALADVTDAVNVDAAGAVMEIDYDTGTPGTGGVTVDGDSFSFLSESTGSCDGFFIKPDGTKAYMISSGGGNTDIYQYSLATPFDLNTMTYDTVTIDVTAQTAAARGIWWKADGTMFWITHFLGTIFEFNVSTPWDLSTAVVGASFPTTGQTSTPQGMHMTADGTKMYICNDTSPDSILQYNMSTPYDITTASFSGGSLSVLAITTSPREVFLSSDGLKMFLLQQSSDKLHEFDLSVAFDVTTGVVNANEIDTQATIAENSPNRLYFSPDGLRIYIGGTQKDSIDSYTLGSAWDISAGSPPVASDHNILISLGAAVPDAVAIPSSTFVGRKATGDAGTMTVSEAQTLLNVADGATANSSDATLLARANHTGTQAMATISDAGALATLNTVGTAQIDNNSVGNTKLADVATATIKGRVTAATGDPEDLTGTQATTLLDVFTTSLKGLVPASGGAASEFLSADGTFKVPAAGGVGKYVSPNQTITPAGSLTLAHSLGGIPDNVIVTIECTTAEHGYSIGDRVNIDEVQSSSNGQGTSMVPDATNLNVRFGAGYGGSVPVYKVLDKTAGTSQDITNANWQAIFTAVKF
jgi:hypothetical protein